jgi:hypothetical protein
MSARRVLGIEGALVDHLEMRIAALTSDDVRAHTLKVAGPAALLVAKQYKIFERLAQPARHGHATATTCIDYCVRSNPRSSSRASS